MCETLYDEYLIEAIEYRRADAQHGRLMQIPAWSDEMCAQIDELRAYLDATRPWLFTTAVYLGLEDAARWK
jgi:hypothetical protein